MEMSKTVDEYIIRHKEWQEELIHLRNLMNATELNETLKWGMPAYTLGGKNVVGICAFKTYFGLWFYQGAFLKDKHKKLINAQEGTTKGMRQWRFQTFDEIDDGIIMDYLQEAIQNQKAGKTIKPERRELVIPPLLEDSLNADPILSEAFNSFTHSRQREFAEYIADAKREPTKKSRLMKVKELILNKVGLNDRYR